MEAYAAILLWAIPAFMVLVIIEIFYGHFTHKQTYTFMDTLSSLSSGMTNIIKDLLGLAIVLIPYPFLEQKIGLFDFSNTVLVYSIAFICMDFASYWVHRLNHKVNLFWNTHIIHHSSEEFNLACALRQTISNILVFQAVFLLPSAFLGVPPKVIITLAPLHLFGQFWYHTRHIGKLGILEYFLVTPSQHRVHHAINPIYIDKNLSAIFCVWDRLFGTFQEELESEPPVYGTLKPVRSWNPLWINFQHLWGILQDAWHTQRWTDKLKIWFMPTGWRPQDVLKKFPRFSYGDPVNDQKKYAPHYNTFWKSLAIFHFVAIMILLLFFLSEFDHFSNLIRIGFGIFLLLCVFGFTALMDLHKWALGFEVFRALLGIELLSLPQLAFFNQAYPLFYILFFIYFGVSLLLTYRAFLQHPSHPLTH